MVCGSPLQENAEQRSSLSLKEHSIFTLENSKFLFIDWAMSCFEILYVNEKDPKYIVFQVQLLIQSISSLA